MTSGSHYLIPGYAGCPATTLRPPARSSTVDGMSKIASGYLAALRIDKVAFAVQRDEPIRTGWGWPEEIQTWAGRIDARPRGRGPGPRTKHSATWARKCFVRGPHALACWTSSFRSGHAAGVQRQPGHHEGSRDGRCRCPLQSGVVRGGSRASACRERAANPADWAPFSAVRDLDGREEQRGSFVPHQRERGTAVASVESRSMDTPDETRMPDKTMVSVVHLSPATVARLQVEPGWRWSECIKPVVGGESCQAAHLGYVVSGLSSHRRYRWRRARSWSQVMPTGWSPGHDAWVVGERTVRRP